MKMSEKEVSITSDVDSARKIIALYYSLSIAFLCDLTRLMPMSISYMITCYAPSSTCQNIISLISYRLVWCFSTSCLRAVESQIWAFPGLRQKYRQVFSESDIKRTKLKPRIRKRSRLARFMGHRAGPVTMYDYISYSPWPVLFSKKSEYIFIRFRKHHQCKSSTVKAQQ